MPQITGPKAYALAAPVIRDEPDIPDNNQNSYNWSTQSFTKSSDKIQPMITVTQPNIFPDFEI
jgi:hypothetical protein